MLVVQRLQRVARLHSPDQPLSVRVYVEPGPRAPNSAPAPPAHRSPAFLRPAAELVRSCRKHEEGIRNLGLGIRLKPKSLLPCRNKPGAHGAQVRRGRDELAQLLQRQRCQLRQLLKRRRLIPQIPGNTELSGFYAQASTGAEHSSCQVHARKYKMAMSYFARCVGEKPIAVAAGSESNAGHTGRRQSGGAGGTYAARLALSGLQVLHHLHMRGKVI